MKKTCEGSRLRGAGNRTSTANRELCDEIETSVTGAD
jgi:hypothetical protein